MPSSTDEVGMTWWKGLGPGWKALGDESIAYLELDNGSVVSVKRVLTPNNLQAEAMYRASLYQEVSPTCGTPKEALVKLVVRMFDRCEALRSEADDLNLIGNRVIAITDLIR